MANNHLKKGADVNKRNNDGDTTMEMNLLTNYFQKVISDRSTKRYSQINLQKFIEQRKGFFLIRSQIRKYWKNQKWLFVIKKEFMMMVITGIFCRVRQR